MGPSAPDAAPAPRRRPLPARRLAAVVGAVAVALLAGGIVAAPASALPSIGLRLVASGLDQPDFVSGAGDGSGRLFVVEQTGRVRIVKGSTVLATPFLDLHSLVSCCGERGLLGLAFHPEYATNGKLYVDYTDVNGNTVVAEYRRSASSVDRADPATARVLLRVTQPYENHNGGMLAFGPDGYLYVGLGDGGSGGDPGNRAQSTSTLLGKILRIDVDGTTSTKAYRIPASNPYVGTTGLDEIWLRGVRNPWRFSFDRRTGDLWIGDVGQDAWEEVDHLTHASGGGRGANLGWRQMEASHCYVSGCTRTGKTLPVAEYSHAGGRCAITGGYVYRGQVVGSLSGRYVFGDFCSGDVFLVGGTSGSVAGATGILATGLNISSFGEDDAGELYVVDLNGRLYRIVPGRRAEG